MEGGGEREREGGEKRESKRRGKDLGPLEIDGAEGCNPYRAPPAVFDLPTGHQIVFSIAFVGTTRRKIPASASRNYGLERDDLIPL